MLKFDKRHFFTTEWIGDGDKIYKEIKRYEERKWN